MTLDGAFNITVENINKKIRAWNFLTSYEKFDILRLHVIMLANYYKISHIPAF